MSNLKVKKAPKLNQVKPVRLNRRFGVKEPLIRDLQAGHMLELPESTARRMAKERYVIIIGEESMTPAVLENVTVEEPEPNTVEKSELTTIEEPALTTIEESEIIIPESNIDDAMEENADDKPKDKRDLYPNLRKIGGNKSSKSKKKGSLE